MKKFNKYGANHKNITKLSGIGWFYKDDTAEGFSYQASQWLDKDSFKLAVKMNDTIKSGVEKMKTHFDSKEHMIKELLDDLHRSIKWWNGYHNLGDRNFGKNYEISLNESVIGCLVSICSCIYILTEEGVIKNDNYNGMLYQYEK